MTNADQISPKTSLKASPKTPCKASLARSATPLTTPLTALPDPASPVTIGIDIGKSFIDVHVAPTGQSMRLPNTAEGHKTLIRSIGQTPVKACVFEATGMYSRAIHSALHAAGYPTMRVNPRQSCLFLKSYSPSHKTDRSDAIGLAAMAAALDFRHVAPETPDQAALRERVTLRQDLVRERVAMQERANAIATPALRKQIDKIIIALEKEIEKLDEALSASVQKDDALNQKAKIIESVPGIGRHSTVALLALLPELGSLTGKQIAALVGVAPVTRDSGAFKGKKFIRGGRGDLRTILFMAALSAMRMNPVIKKWLASPSMAAKPHKVQRIATVRKLLVILNAMVKNNQPWTEKTT